ncbi:MULTISPECIES: methyl-accepting chemotaxis protein [unclassified Sphingomonas]|uniref:methyl-accepting chemotaxis protein n=1 Tax=unclassified Sphingomonas TaxID=196159 RepID=UPI0022B45C83|nr:methyl-accepting chemotaxis protein [Sphingomonas sp. NIBR02145]WHU04677.1 methyl-accepting chemotaxis protein [Sphingomonas sp. NIBR02145]
MKITSLNKATTQAAAVLIGITALSGGTGLFIVAKENNAIAQQAAAAGLLQNHMEADMMHDAVRADVLAALVGGDDAARKQTLDDLKDHLGTLSRTINEDAAFQGIDSIVAATSKLKAPMDAYAAAAQKIVDTAASDPLAARAQMPGFMDQFRALEKSMESASEAIEGHAKEVASSSATLGTVAMIVLFLTLLAGMAAAFLLAQAARRLLVRPLLDLADTMRALDSGDLSVKVPHAAREDELGGMAQAIDAFRDKLKAAEEAKEAQTKLIVETIGTSLDAMARGDLSVEIDAELTGPFAALKRSFNDAAHGLRSLIGTVVTGTENIRTGANEIASASEDLARRTERNAATLEETNAAVNAIDHRLKSIALSANETLSRADGAIAVVGTGRAIADEAVQAMTRVSESAKGIDSVIEGLDKIAFQTRVLAMNAAVEAGRAGEAGRGFAVVADLVSALAMRAEEEAGRARDQLTHTQAEVVTAVDAVMKVDGALADISGDVGQVHALIGTMAEDNNAQSHAISQVSEAIGDMDRGTQQNAAMVEETSAAARNLTQEVDSLADSAANFTIDAPHGHRAAPQRQVVNGTTVH